MSRDRRRILCILPCYPQLSESYQHEELERLDPAQYEIRIASLWKHDYPIANPRPFTLCETQDELLALAKAFQPHLIHGHWLIRMDAVTRLAEALQVPFTIRAHSFDVFSFANNPTKLGPEPIQTINGDLCLGVLSFPFGRPLLRGGGIRDDKIYDAWPVANVPLFENHEPNGKAVLHNGACLPKKAFTDFIDVAKQMPEKQFNLYPIGYERAKIVEYNERAGRPVAIYDEVEHHDMPPVYKRHEWLFYTADFKMATVGWPLAVAEAQAAGVCVLMANLRPDLREYVGPGGFLYDSLAQAREILSRPVPAEFREVSFEHAKKSDIHRHINVLTDTWAPAFAGLRRVGQAG